MATDVLHTHMGTNASLEKVQHLHTGDLSICHKKNVDWDARKSLICSRQRMAHVGPINIVSAEW